MGIAWILVKVAIYKVQILMHVMLSMDAASNGAVTYALPAQLLGNIEEVTHSLTCGAGSTEAHEVRQQSSQLTRL